MELRNVGLTIARNPRNVGLVREGRSAMQKRVNFFRLLLPMVALALWSGPSHALKITPSYGPEFTLFQRVIIAFSIISWTNHFAKGGHNIDIKFVANDSFDRFGLTHSYQFDNMGRTIAAVITLDTDDLSWRVLSLDPEGVDAFTAVSHEIGHAIGFTYNSPIFKASVCVVGGVGPDQCGVDIVMSGDRYLDLNHNRQKDAGDINLVDVGSTHFRETPKK
jgi:hypothetical protein